MGLREKARQGLLTGSLPWGYRQGRRTRSPRPTPRRRRTSADCLRCTPPGAHRPHPRRVAERQRAAHHPRPAVRRGHRPRDALQRRLLPATSPAAATRSKAIKGLHEPIVDEALFDRVQEMRRQRARTLKPGRPSQRYLLRGLARCERCQAKMQGTAVGRELDRALLLRHAPRRPLLRPAHHRPPSRRGATRRSSSATSHPPPRSARRSCAASPTPPHPRPAKPPNAAPRWKSACAGCATSTNSATSAPRLHRPPRRAPRRARSTRPPADPRPRPRPAGLKDFTSSGQRERPRRQATAPQPHLRGRLARRRPRRCRPAQGAVPPLLQRIGAQASCLRGGKVRERRGSNPRLLPRGSRYESRCPTSTLVRSGHAATLHARRSKPSNGPSDVVGIGLDRDPLSAQLLGDRPRRVAACEGVEHEVTLVGEEPYED